LVTVVSDDPQLHRLSWEVLCELHREDLLVPAGVPITEAGRKDICIIDWPPKQTIPEPFRTTQHGRCLYLVERDQVEKITASLPRSLAGVLVKPVNRNALKFSLEQAIGSAEADLESRELPPAGSDRDDILQCLLIAYLRLQEHDRDRMNFLSRAVHDFRAPLTAVNGYCGLFLEGLLGPLAPAQKEVLQRIQQSARRLSRLAIAMHELTTRGQGRPGPDLAAYSIEDSVAQAVHEIRPGCDERGVSIVVQLAESPEPLYFDAVQIEQVLVNLLDNAGRFAKKHGVIEVSGYPYRLDRLDDAGYSGSDRSRGLDPNCYRVDVKDNGPAIAPELLPLIFEENVPNCGEEGRSAGGLGLAVCKSIIDSHNGDIWAGSGLDGTVFSFVLPLRRKTGDVSPEAPQVVGE